MVTHFVEHILNEFHRHSFGTLQAETLGRTNGYMYKHISTLRHRRRAPSPKFANYVCFPHIFCTVIQAILSKNRAIIILSVGWTELCEANESVNLIKVWLLFWMRFLQRYLRRVHCRICEGAYVRRRNGHFLPWRKCDTTLALLQLAPLMPLLCWVM